MSNTIHARDSLGFGEGTGIPETYRGLFFKGGLDLGHLDDIIRAYDCVATKYDKVFHDELDNKPDDRRWLDRFAAELFPGALVCDAGCGPCGHVTHYLHDRGLCTFGLDISPVCVDIARRRHPGIRFEVMDMSQMDLPDGSLDGVVSFHSIIHTPKRFVPELFREFHRVLRPGGRLLLVVKGGDGEGYVESLLDVPAHVWFSHFSESEIRQYCIAAGFSPAHLETRMPYDFEISVPRICLDAWNPQDRSCDDKERCE